MYRQPHRTLAGTLAAALAITTLAGCSAQTSYGNYPSGVATSYFHRLYNKDFAGACQLFTDQLRTSLGDCPAALSRARGALPVGERDELRDVSVRTAIHATKDSAQVRTTDVTVTATLAPQTGRQTPKPRSTRVRSLSASHLTDGHGLRLVKVGTTWRISDCGL